MTESPSSIQPNPAPPTSTQDQPTRSLLSRILRFWPGLVILIIIILLALIYFYAVNQFASNVTIDHAEHGRTSPTVHEIVYVRQALLVGVNSDFAPLSYKIDGELVGFEIDLAKAIANELNVPVRFVEFEFRDAFSETGLSESNPLTEDRVDMVIAGLSSTEYSSEMFGFSKSYLESGQVAISKSTNTEINSLSSLAGRVIAVESDSPGHRFISSFGQAGEVKEYDTPKLAIEAVAGGQADAFIGDAPNAKSFLESYPDLHIATELLTHDEYAVLTMRNETDLIDEVDSIIENLRQRGVLESLRQKWLE